VSVEFAWAIADSDNCADRNPGIANTFFVGAAQIFAPPPPPPPNADRNRRGKSDRNIGKERFIRKTFL